MLKEFGVNTISDALNWVMTFANRAHKESPEIIKQRMPGFLGLSLEDERIFASLRINLNVTEDMHLTNFLNYCKDYERNRFRNIVAGMPESTETTTTGSHKNKKITTKKVSSGTKFLKRIARLVNDYGPEEAYRRCLSGNVIVKDPIGQIALTQWFKSVKWFKEKVISTLNVNQLSDIDLSQIGNDLALRMNDSFEARKQELNDRPLWKKILW